MKVSIYETVEITDEQRKQIGAVLGVKWPDRDQLKAFFWEHGKNWEAALTPAAAEPELDDLI